MILEIAKEKVNSWKFRLITTRKRAKDICDITGYWPSKVSMMLNAKPEQVGKFRLCEFTAIEGAIQGFEDQHYKKQREE